MVRAMDESRLHDGVVALRPWRETDAEAIVECLDGDPEVTRWLDRVPQPYTLADARAYISGLLPLEQDTFAITDAATGRVLGSIGAAKEHDGVREVGYWLRADARGRGATTRALVLVARWALAQAGVERVQLRADTENVASCRVAEKAGFTREGVLRSAHWNPRLGRRQDWAIYSVLPGEL
jgi:RimJ/RimL family protein N-acetyltransferase